MHHLHQYHLVTQHRDMVEDFFPISENVFRKWLYSNTRLLVIVPGHGQSERLPQLKKSLRALQRSALSSATNDIHSNANGTIAFHCIVYVWNRAVLQHTAEQLHDCCTVEYSEGMWTDHMHKVPDPPTVMVTAVNNNSTNNNNTLNTTTTTCHESATHVAVLLDDVDASDIDLPSFFRTMALVNYSVATAAIPDWHYSSIRPRPECLAHRTGHADVLFTVYTARMWKCWIDKNMNRDVNRYGWGFDVTMADVCDATVGVVDHVVGIHNPVCPDDQPYCVTRSYSDTTAKMQMIQWIRNSMNLTTEYEVDQYYKFVVDRRPWSFPYCDLPRHVLWASSVW
jgi:hypothetical protein